MHSEHALRDTLVAAIYFDKVLQMNLYHKLMGLYSRKIAGCEGRRTDERIKFSGWFGASQRGLWAAISAVGS